jgi:4-hydroxy-tetrahydrodipicolinate reductase
MKIALIGYGKMGKAIEEVSVKRGHSVLLRISGSNREEFTAENLSKVDVAIEFTGADSAFSNIQKCLEAGVPVVSGSTGWTDQLPELKKIADEQGMGLIYSSNFSIGVNIFFEINNRLAELMKKHEHYEVRIEEIHHTQKKDAPSGTAISLAEQILKHLPHKKNWVNTKAMAEAELEILSRREDPMPGTHEVFYESEIDSINIRHTAHSRKGFASGAVTAAEFILGKKGFFTMKDVLNF